MRRLMNICKLLYNVILIQEKYILKKTIETLSSILCPLRLNSYKKLPNMESESDDGVFKALVKTSSSKPYYYLRLRKH